jgi:hypothetical protein
MQISYVGRFIGYACNWTPTPCLGGDNERQLWIWDPATNELQINLSWQKVDHGANKLGLAVRMYDWNNYQQPEQEIRYKEDVSPIQIVLKGDEFMNKHFTIVVEVPPKEGMVIDQPFDVEITKWQDLG